MTIKASFGEYVYSVPTTTQANQRIYFWVKMHGYVKGPQKVGGRDEQDETKLHRKCVIYSYPHSIKKGKHPQWSLNPFTIP